MKRFLSVLTLAFALAGCETTPAPSQSVTLYKIEFSGKFFEVGQVEVKPRALHTVAPRYPAKQRARHEEGKAVVALIVEPDGSLSEIQVAAATDPEIGDAAIASVRQWRFLPGRKDGQPVRVRIEIPIVFTMDDSGLQ